MGGGGDTESKDSAKEMSEKKEDQGQEEGAGKEEGLEARDREEGSRHEGSSSPVHGFTTPAKIDNSLVVSTILVGGLQLLLLLQNFLLKEFNLGLTNSGRLLGVTSVFLFLVYVCVDGFCGNSRSQLMIVIDKNICNVGI